MNRDTFIEKIETEFDELLPGTLQPETSFKDLDEWSSMHALIIIALVDTEYDVVLTGDDMAQLTTVDDLFEVVKSRRK